MKRLYISLFVVFVALSALAVMAGWHKASFLQSETEEEFVPYASIFQAQAPALGWDWHLLAALAWHESHFNPRARSYAGACGIMQLMPQTARNFGLNETTIWEPEPNIKAGVQYLVCLEDKWSFIASESERTKFVLASYNAGHGTVFKARRMAKQAGVYPNRWAEVEPFMNQRTTKRYVNQVLSTANRYIENDAER